MSGDPTVLPSPLTRFDQARADAAEAATNALSVTMMADAVSKLGRCVSLMVPVQAGVLGKVINRREVTRTLSAVIAEMQEVVSELGE